MERKFHDLHKFENIHEYAAFLKLVLTTNDAGNKSPTKFEFSHSQATLKRFVLSFL
jgi:hypothetical protein